MKKIIVCILLYVYVSMGLTKGQISEDIMAGSLEKLFGRLRTSSEDSISLRINDSIKLFIENYIASDKIFTHKFTNLRYLGQISSSDSLIKIVTWNLILNNEPGRYFCYLIRKSPEGQANNVYYLTRNYNDKPILTDTSYTQSEWYGALYYAIEPCRKDYVILGLDFGSEMVSRKVIDVISFTPDGEVIFGKDFFIRDNEKKFREVIEYSSESIVTLRFNSPKTIVFDHLDTFSTGDGNEKSLGTGLSTDGYIYKKGIWKFTTGIDARNPRN